MISVGTCLTGSHLSLFGKLKFPSPGDLPDPGIEPWSPTLRADALLSEPPGKPAMEELPYNPAIPLLGIHTEETRIERDTCTPIFITALQ